jgi:hypothetical protein
MSFTITAQAIPSVARSDWETVDEYLLHKQGDWKILRGGLIHLVCDRVTRDGDPVSRLEEFLLCEFYRQPPVHAGFLDALRLVRAELVAWPEEARNLVEHLLAQNRDFPVGGPHFPAAFDRIRYAASKAVSAPLAPTRDLSRFLRQHCRPSVAADKADV